MKVHFHLPYDHRWPSRAVTHFPAGYQGTVKREVGEAAIGKGKATEIKSRATLVPDARKVSGRSDAVGGGDLGSTSAGGARGDRGRDSGNSDGAGAAVPGAVNSGDAQ